MVPKLFGFACLFLISSVYCEENGNRDARFSIFQIIKFANEPCEGGTRNGTCFTKQECEDQGGTDSGSCADGFGVCCSIVLEESGSTSLNQSYMVQTSTTTPTTGTRQYTICPCSTDVCRIRFDFTQFMIAPPYIPTPDAGAVLSDGSKSMAEEAFATGDCTIDSFSISGPSGGTPVICGTNDGQHMIVDTDGSTCVTVNFAIGGGSDTRNWDIMTTQYRCGEEAGGPPGCLQWNMAAQGDVRSFNFPRQARGAAVSDDVVHLSSQHYSICIRRPTGTTSICYIPCTYVAMDGNANVQQSFGLSIANADETSHVDTTFCSQDYIEIMGGTTAANAAMGVNSDNNIWCGRNFATADNVNFANAAAASVCTSSVPFRIRVNFNEDEFRKDNTPNGVEAAVGQGDFFGRPGGIMGFSLCYTTQ